MGQQPVRALYVTLRRSFAGTRDTQCAVVRALGLRYRQQTVRVPNNAKMRGAIAKVPPPPQHHSRYITSTISRAETG